VDEGARAAGPAVSQEGDTRTPEEIRRDIEQTREEVGDTVEALAAKTDVKAQAHARVEEIKANVREHAPASAQEGAATVAAQAREHRMVLLGAGALLLAFWLGRRSGRP
jgi:Protein of unknown function (DUF3618)